MTPDEWFDSVRQMVDEIRDSTTKIVWLVRAADGQEHQGLLRHSVSVPADCISRVTGQWLSMAATEQRLAESVGGVWVDSRPWFCNDYGRCPSFVGVTPTKVDVDHVTSAYGKKIFSVMGESFSAAGVF